MHLRMTADRLDSSCAATRSMRATMAVGIFTPTYVVARGFTVCASLLVMLLSLIAFHEVSSRLTARVAGSETFHVVSMSLCVARTTLARKIASGRRGAFAFQAGSPRRSHFPGRASTVPLSVPPCSRLVRELTL